MENKQMKKLYHTSPEEIGKIHPHGRFGPGLFFADQPYYMSEASNNLYGLDIDEEELIDANEFSNLSPEEYRKIQHIVKDIQNVLHLDEETALDLLSENKDIFGLFSELEDSINSYDEEDEEDKEKINRMKNSHRKLSKSDLGELSWDLQRKGLRAASFLNKKGVGLRDEQGKSYLINLMNNEHRLKKILENDMIEE